MGIEDIRNFLGSVLMSMWCQCFMPSSLYLGIFNMLV